MDIFLVSHTDDTVSTKMCDYRICECAEILVKTSIGKILNEQDQQILQRLRDVHSQVLMRGGGNCCGP